MTLTPETLVCHELNGLHVRVVEATDQSLVGREGRVVSETTATLVVDTDSGVVRLPKAHARFEFRCAPTDEAAARRATDGASPDASREGAGTGAEPAGTPVGEAAAYVTVDGGALLARPARRTEQEVPDRWQSDWT